MFCRLDELGLEAIGQRLEPDQSIILCRVLERDDWCHKCGCQGIPRGTVIRRLAHEPYGWKPTRLHVKVRRYTPRYTTTWGLTKPRPHAEYSWFASAVKTAVAVNESFPRVTPHDLRHTAASLAVSAGANVKAVQRMLGRASAAMTLDVYADLFDNDLDVVAVNLSEARRIALEA